MTNFRTLDKSAEILFEETLQKVRDRFDVRRKEPNVGLKTLVRFEELKKYQSLFVHRVTELKGASGSFIILLIDKHSTIVRKKKNGAYLEEIQEIEPVLVFNLQQDVGKAFIRTETVTDKLVDLFIRVDIDFKEYPNFSKNYLVVGEKPDEIQKYLPRGLIESLEKIEGMIIEINGNMGLVRSEKNLTENLLLQLLSIGYKITK
ncbi:MAG: hypothetical protein J0L67_12465 [Cytophagales bacterium]|nr:hypothetical protein [Cytophagales bacterium]